MVQSINFDRAVNFYDETRGFPPEVAAQVGAFIAESARFTPQQRLLEIGIGTGRIALPLAAYVQSIYGVDISAQMMGKLRQKQTDEAIYTAQADAQWLPFAPHSFDGIVISHVLHLVADPEQVIRELRRVALPTVRLVHCHLKRINDARMQAVMQTAEVRVIEGRVTEQDSLLQANGWFADERYFLPYKISSTPREYLRMVEQRIWSSTWHLSAEQHHDAVNAIKNALTAQFGNDWDEPIQQENHFMVDVYTLAAS
jgi:ubiquinone/menaquinone biosynthesis C-methylase UbiE